VTALLWALPLAEELTARPGNMTRLATWFWEHRDDGQPVLGAVNTWARALAGALLPRFAHPVGWAVPPAVDPVATILAPVQVAALVAVAWRDRGSSWAIACGLAAATEGIALLSILRMPGEVQDHAVFWMGILGTIGWGLLAGIVAMRLAPGIARAMRTREHLVSTTLALAPAALALLLAAGAFARSLAPAGPNATAQQVRDLTAATVEGLARHRAGSPLVRIDGEVWSEAAGTLLQLHKRGVPFVVERESIHMFGAPLAAAGCDRTHVLRFVPAGSRAEGAPIARAGSVEARLEAAPACGSIDP
jgi:hypothetical protein